VDGEPVSLSAADAAAMRYSGGLSLSPRSLMPAPLTDDQVVLLVAKYLRERDRFQKMALAVQRHLQAALKHHIVRCVVTARSKDRDSLRKKLRKNAEELDYDRLREEFGPDLLDLAGARVMLYEFDRDAERVVRLIEDTFVVSEEPRFRKNHGAGDTRCYQARHRVVSLRPDQTEDPEFENLKGVLCEVQVVSLVKHIWNELEHDIRYKDPEHLGDPSEEQSAWLSVLWDSLQAADTAVEHLSRVTDHKRAIVQDESRPLEDAEALRLALGNLIGRPVTGNVQQLYALLNTTEKTLSVNALRETGIHTNEAQKAGSRQATSVGFSDPDDCEQMVASMFAERGKDFADLAAGWRGPRTRLRRLIEELSKVAEGRGGVQQEPADCDDEPSIDGSEPQPNLVEDADADPR